MTSTSPNLNNSNVGFSALQVQCLRNSFVEAGGTNEIDTLNLGQSGTAGTLKIYPSTASKGDLKIVATDNTGNTETTITNAAFGQATTLTIPDPGAASASFVLTGAMSAQRVDNINMGASGSAGTFKIFPGTASKGDLKIVAANNTGNTETTITNAAFGQATTLTIPDPGASTANFLLDTGTNATGTITKISTGATPVPLLDIAGTTLTPAAGAANVCNVTIQLKDGAGTNMARIIPLIVYLSDSSTGAGVTATTASGTVVAGATGTDIVDLTSKKVKQVLTNASGSYTLAITDTSKTGFYVCASTLGQGVKVSAQLITGNYG